MESKTLFDSQPSPPPPPLMAGEEEIEDDDPDARVRPGADEYVLCQFQHHTTLS